MTLQEGQLNYCYQTWLAWIVPQSQFCSRYTIMFQRRRYRGSKGYKYDPELPELPKYIHKMNQRHLLQSKLCISDINIRNRRIVVRTDFNVPLSPYGQILDSEKIHRVIPTIKFLLGCDCYSILLISHIGDAGGKKNEYCSLEPVAKELDKILYINYGLTVEFLHDIFHHEVRAFCSFPPRRSIAVLENIQFYPEEFGTTKDNTIQLTNERISRFRRIIKSFGDIYVNEAFSLTHLTHSSILAQYFPISVTGLYTQKTLNYFQRFYIEPKRPVCAILGGDKIDIMLSILDNLLDFVDYAIIGGGLAFTFLKETKNMKIGDSLFLKHSGRIVRNLMRKAQHNGVMMYLPCDFMVGRRDSERSRFCPVEEGIPKGKMGLDIGFISLNDIRNFVKKSNTILLYGPMGVVEESLYEDGTADLIELLNDAYCRGAETIIVGETTGNFARKKKLARNVSHICAGEATLHLLLGRKLPGLEALLTKGVQHCRKESLWYDILKENYGTDHQRQRRGKTKKKIILKEDGKHYNSDASDTD
ncbi:Phosphoglycerate kinase [Gryllus bimaculatus]|nr:Phosphoglycerate kinase [Gryllus bimaculatus]